MTWGEKLVQYLLGGSIGVIVATMAAFASGSIVYSNEMEEAVRKARIQTLAPSAPKAVLRVGGSRVAK